METTSNIVTEFYKGINNAVYQVYTTNEQRVVNVLLDDGKKVSFNLVVPTHGTDVTTILQCPTVTPDEGSDYLCDHHNIETPLVAFLEMTLECFDKVNDGFTSWRYSADKGCLWLMTNQMVIMVTVE